MMIPLTQEQLDLYEQLEKAKSLEEKNKIEERLSEIRIEREKEFDNYPFAH